MARDYWKECFSDVSKVTAKITRKSAGGVTRTATLAVGATGTTREEFRDAVIASLAAVAAGKAPTPCSITEAVSERVGVETDGRSIGVSQVDPQILAFAALQLLRIAVPDAPDPVPDVVKDRITAPPATAPEPTRNGKM